MKTLQDLVAKIKEECEGRPEKHNIAWEDITEVLFYLYETVEREYSIEYLWPCVNSLYYRLDGMEVPRPYDIEDWLRYMPQILVIQAYLEQGGDLSALVSSQEWDHIQDQVNRLQIVANTLWERAEKGEYDRYGGPNPPELKELMAEMGLGKEQLAQAKRQPEPDVIKDGDN